MLNENVTYAKTQKGIEEIATKAHRLSPRLRTLLIFVDGQTSTSRLIEKAEAVGQGAAAVGSLLSEGFIGSVDDVLEEVSSTATSASVALAPKPRLQAPLPPPSSPPVPPLPPLPPAPPVMSRRSLAIARMYLLDSMERMYGNSSLVIRDVLRNATTKEAILVQLEHCVEIVREGSDGQRAEEFRNRVLNLLPE